MGKDSRLTTLMSADLASLLFLVLLAMITTVSYGTPDPAQEFLVQIGKCLALDIDRETTGCELDASNRADAAQRILDVDRAKFEGEDENSPIDEPAPYSICATGPASYKNKFPGQCDTTLTIELDFDERVIRLADTFGFDKKDVSEGSKEYEFIDHVVATIADVTARQKKQEREKSQFSEHPGLANSYFDLLIIEGHADHIVTRKVTRDEQNEILPYDYNVKLGMTRARYLASRFDKQSEDIDVVVASVGCHRPLKNIGPIGDSDPKLTDKQLRHDRACFREEKELTSVLNDSRLYVEPSIVGQEGDESPADRILRDREKNEEAGNQEIRNALARNRRVEIRVLFKVGET